MNCRQANHLARCLPQDVFTKEAVNWKALAAAGMMSAPIADTAITSAIRPSYKSILQAAGTNVMQVPKTLMGRPVYSNFNEVPNLNKFQRFVGKMTGGNGPAGFGVNPRDNSKFFLFRDGKMPTDIVKHEMGHASDFSGRYGNNFTAVDAARDSTFTLNPFRESPRLATERRAWELGGVPASSPVRNLAYKTYTLQDGNLKRLPYELLFGTGGGSMWLRRLRRKQYEDGVRNMLRNIDPSKWPKLR